jgi:hypothetical protein
MTPATTASETTSEARSSSGTAPTGPATSPFAAEVAAYLDDCAACRPPLDSRYHPTEDGAVKMIPHRRHADREADKTAEDQIRAAFRAAVERPARRESGTSGTSGTRAGHSTDSGFRMPAGVPEPPEPVPPVRQEETGMPDDRAALERAALRAAARGWRVFPLRPRDKRPAFPKHTADDCNGTDPWCRNGHQTWEPRATTDPARIRRAWSAARYNVGIATGPSGLVVIDLDPPKPGEVPPPRWNAPGIRDGADVLAALCEEHGQPFPCETFMVRTRRGGWHLYFTAPAGAALRSTSGQKGGGLGWLIDTRAHGGYVVGPGSFVDLRDGTGRYEVTYDRPPAPLPGWLAALLTAPRPESPSVAGRSSCPDQVRQLDIYVRTALYGECERVRTAAEGGRAWALNKAGFQVGRLIAVGALDDDTAERELLAAASIHFGAARPVTPGEARKAIRGGIAAGKRNPRSIGAAA